MSSYRIDIPEEGDKLQIHVQGCDIEGGQLGAPEPLNALIYELDLGEIFKGCRESDKTMFLNAFISVKSKPVLTVVVCPDCQRNYGMDVNLGANHYQVCDCGASFNAFGDKA